MYLLLSDGAVTPPGPTVYGVTDRLEDAGLEEWSEHLCEIPGQLPQLAYSLGSSRWAQLLRHDGKSRTQAKANAPATDWTADLRSPECGR